jgi:ABC-2 type transport system permease protein
MTTPPAARPLGAGTPATPSSWLRMATALTAYELRLVLRRGEGLLISFVIPAGVLLVFSALDAAGGSDGSAAVGRLLPGAIALAVIATSLVSLAISTGYERAYGVIKRLGASPAGTSAMVAAKTGSVLLVEAVQVVLLVGIAVGLLGFQAGPAASLPVMLVALLLGTVAFAGLGLLMAGTLRAEATLALANLLFLVCLVLGGIVLPLDRLPPAVASIASVLPPAALTESLAIGLGTTIADATEPMAVLAGWAILLAVLAARRFRWD